METEQKYNDLYKNINQTVYEHIINIVDSNIDKDNIISILDIGCWDGKLGKLLKLKYGDKIDIKGLERSKEALSIALEVGYSEIINVDLNYIEDKNLYNKKFDVIVFGDVLEHILDPKLTVEKIALMAGKDTIFIISVPNVAFILNRIKLLFGDWNYEETGILDKTHIWFYTFKTFNAFISSLNLEGNIYGYTSLKRGVVKFKYFLKTLFSYQIIFVGKKIFK